MSRRCRPQSRQRGSWLLGRARTWAQEYKTSPFLRRRTAAHLLPGSPTQHRPPPPSPDSSVTRTRLLRIARDLVGNVVKDRSIAAEATTTIASDTTPPVILPQIAGMLGNNGWYRSAVTVSWSVTDPESGIASSSGCDTSILTADTAGVILTCSATDGAGLSSSVPATIKIDQTPPTLNPRGQAQPRSTQCCCYCLIGCRGCAIRRCLAKLRRSGDELGWNKVSYLHSHG